MSESSTASRATLPTPATSFLGRGAELAESERLLAGTRLLTVTGPGGAGKTRFALELARRLEPRFPGGAVACFFASLRDPSLVLPTIAHALDVREEGGRSALEALVQRLEDAELLLLLDNLEHLPDAVPDLSELLIACPHLTLLVTSRARLRVTGEVVYELPPLGADESVALFCERAHVEPSSIVRELCTRLEGLPLAIELAAARLSLLSPEQLLERLSKRLDLLKAGRGADPRQQTLRATIEWSYDLLSEDEQRLFRSLSVFRGGCTLEAAEEVCGAELDTLESLCENSLLRRADGRYSMLATIREYAERLLDEEGAAGRLRAAHARHYTGLALSSDVGLAKGDPGTWAAITPEADNLRAAISASLELDPLRALDACRALDRFWQHGARDREGYETLRRALAAAPDAVPLDRGRALIAAASLAIRLGTLDDAGELLDEAVAELRRAESAPRIAAALNNRGLVALLLGDLPVARACLEESLALRRALGERATMAPALSNLGKLSLYEGDLAAARELLDEAVEIRRAFSSQQLHQTLFDLAVLDALAGEPGRAVGVSAEALRHAEDVDDPAGAIEAGALLAVCSVLSGDVERAGEALRAAIERCVDGGYEGRLPFVLWACAGYATARGRASDGLLLLGATEDAGSAEGGELFGGLWGERVLAGAREALPESRVAELLDQGRSLSAKAALARALALVPTDETAGVRS
jgi:predicted ATPase